MAQQEKNPPATKETEGLGSILGSGRSLGGGCGNPLQCSCLENPLDRGAWRAAVHGVTKSRTRLSDSAHKAHVEKSFPTRKPDHARPRKPAAHDWASPYSLDSNSAHFCPATLHFFPCPHLSAPLPSFISNAFLASLRSNLF